MQKSLVLAAALLFIFNVAAAEDIIGVFQTGEINAFVDSVQFKYTSSTVIHPTPDFGGNPDTEDTFNFGRVEWPEQAQVFWTMDEESQLPLGLRAVEEDVYYSFPEWEQTRIKFISVPSGIEEGETRGRTSVAAFPNPFRSRTAIRFRLPAPGRASLRVFDPAGRVVWTRNAWFDAGSRVFDWDARGHGPGVYFARLGTPAGAGLVRLTLAE